MLLNNESTKCFQALEHYNICCREKKMYQTLVTNTIMPNENIWCSKEAMWCGKHQEYAWSFKRIANKSWWHIQYKTHRDSKHVNGLSWIQWKKCQHPKYLPNKPKSVGQNTALRGLRVLKSDNLNVKVFSVKPIINMQDNLKITILS